MNTKYKVMVVIVAILLNLNLSLAGLFSPITPPPGPGPPGPPGPPGNLSSNYSSGSGIIINGSGVISVDVPYLNGFWVNKSGDNMIGNLNMSDNNITDVNFLYVHNISGRSPIGISSPLVSNTSITADNFYGNFLGDNGTIFGVNINNGTIVNLKVNGSALFNSPVDINGDLYVNANLVCLQNGSNCPTFSINTTGGNKTVVEQVWCDGNCTTVIEYEYTY